MSTNGKHKLTAMMLVRNEAERYLNTCLSHLNVYTDEIIILDDASTDNTSEVCLTYPKVKLYRNEEPMFIANESLARKKLWQLVEKSNPDWILAIDADEVFEDQIESQIGYIMAGDDYDAVEFRIFDFWKSMTHYRVDGLWNPWNRFSTLLIRYQPGKVYSWPDLPLHCGRIPMEYRSHRIKRFQSNIRVKHFGWADEKDHIKKYAFYKQKDPEGRLQAKNHLESVLDKEVKLEEWTESKSLSF
ncbi:MAG: hypothetical protein PWQ82_1294 [Thermosediminibacterales bacterium]|nr:hypothetical protein [Thermosediminibacterales bacterium]MDK2836514.1 hypothetical protein [Thermosediminibacterales bacterium]